MIGQRLKLSRSAAGFSLRELETAIGNRVSAQAIGKYERNESVPSSGVLIALAKGLGVSVDYLLGDQDLTLKGVEFRRKKITKKKDEAQVESKVIGLLEKYLVIEDVLCIENGVWDKPRGAPYPVIKDESEADRAARVVRQEWGLGQDPIPCLVEILEERGIKVLSLEQDKFDGLTASVDRADGQVIPVIMINKSDWAERKRFNLAHELGHMVLQIGAHLNAEKAAHRFAAAFLMPAEALWSEVGKSRKAISMGELCELKKLFGASIQAITYRCRDLGIIGHKQFKYLFDEFESRGWRSWPYKEPFAISPEEEEPRRFERLCFRALAEGVISESKAAELVGLGVQQLNDKMDHPEM